jgi:hypothetical protein
MSDFMMSQVQGMLGKVADDIDRMSRTTSTQSEMLLEAINDLAANMFATQSILIALLRDHPVDAKTVKDFITKQTDAAGTDAPKALAIVDLLLSDAKKK